MDERRQFQRLRLIKPILATARGENVLILDLGMAGALVEHRGPAQAGERFTLSFTAQGSAISYVCEVAHTEPHGLVSHSGLRFIEAVGESAKLLRDLIGSFLGKVLTAQKANASGGFRSANTETILEQLGGARRARTPGFTSYRFSDGAWVRSITTSPVQPQDGFTVAGYEEDEDLATLCRAYEAADEEGRTLIRLMAELSISR